MLYTHTYHAIQMTTVGYALSTYNLNYRSLQNDTNLRPWSILIDVTGHGLQASVTD